MNEKDMKEILTTIDSCKHEISNKIYEESETVLPSDAIAYANFTINIIKDKIRGSK